MRDSITPPTIGKPAKPHPDFPLFPHATRRWAKKVKGKLHYFGPWDQPDAALEKWLLQKDDLLAGRVPRGRVDGGATMQEVVNHFLNAKTSAHRAGELSDILYSKYFETCERAITHFGKGRPLSDLRPVDFGAYRDTLAAKWGPVTLGAEIQRLRTVFKYAVDNQLIPSPVIFGTLFKKPSRAQVRKHKAEQPRKLFTPDEIRALLSEADPQMAAMILLGINAGWGNKDVAGVHASHIDLKAGIASYGRAKTGIGRRVTLWAETVAAIRKAITSRPTPKAPSDVDLVFVTKYGNPWRVTTAELVTGEGDKRHVRWNNTDSVGLEFGKLLRRVRIKRNGKMMPVKRLGLNFYTLRHTFKTVAESAGDIPAVNRIMGHEDSGDVGTHYREWSGDAAEDKRLRKVTNHVRKWLYKNGR